MEYAATRLAQIRKELEETMGVPIIQIEVPADQLLLDVSRAIGLSDEEIAEVLGFEPEDAVALGITLLKPEQVTGVEWIPALEGL